LLEQSKVGSIKVVFDARLPPGEAQRLPIGATESEAADLAGWAPTVRDIDTTILVYADALGLTFGGLERRLLAAGARNIIVLNGRRRLFPLTSRARRSFRWRRLLASTRIVELMAAISVLPVAAILAGYDRLKRS
jgi:hypothetical protein